jgi:L-seryl-tRNA(Ser) seleniumtransferase
MTSPKRTEITGAQQALLKKLPGVDAILEDIHEQGLKGPAGDIRPPRSVLTRSVRKVIGELRSRILDHPGKMSDADLSPDAVRKRVEKAVRAAMEINLKQVINATGVVVHTNLGRSILSEGALAHMHAVASRYSNLEFDLSAGSRGSRYTAVEDLLCEISGADAAIVVNNNAAAVLLSLDTIARGREAIVSRGELVEIGGSFRVPDVMAKSGAILREVGTTNRTHLFDYENNVNDQTGLILKVHTSNYAIVGFTKSVPLRELVGLGLRTGLPVMEDLGSGTFVDFSAYGLMKEPTVQESVGAGADIVTFSGDKLLGGPQSGIIVGKTPLIERIKKNPLTRALRIDKLTLAALESTLRAYRDEKSAMSEIPTLSMMNMPLTEIDAKAHKLQAALQDACAGRLESEIVDSSSRVGGGALPLLSLPTRCIAIIIRDMNATRLESRLRANRPPIIARIEDERVLLDMRTVAFDEYALITEALTRIAGDAQQ